jgi:hypothetical protein
MICDICGYESPTAVVEEKDGIRRCQWCRQRSATGRKFIDHRLGKRATPTREQWLDYERRLEELEDKEA